MLAPRSKKIIYGNKEFDINFTLDKFETSEADELMATTWNLNYKTEKKAGEICGKDLTFPDIGSFEEPSHSDSDIQFQVSNRTFINFFKAMTQSGILCQYFSSKLDGTELIKFKPIFAGDLEFEPYENTNSHTNEVTQGIKLSIPFRFGFYTNIGELINFQNDETISGKLNLVYEVIDSCSGLTFGLKTFELEGVEGTMEISGTVTNPTLSGSSQEKKFSESWSKEFIKNFGRLSISTKTINIPEYEYDFSLSTNNLKPFDGNGNNIYDQDIEFKIVNESEEYIIGINEFSPSDNSMSFGAILREGSLDCCNEFGKLSCPTGDFGIDPNNFKKFDGDLELNYSSEYIFKTDQVKGSKLERDLPY